MPQHLSTHPVHLGKNAKACSEPAFTGMSWYAGYEQRHEADGAEGRLVSMYTFSENWTSWEMHPMGGEVVICTGGKLTVIQEVAGDVVKTTLEPGQYVINEPGVWHTADVSEPTTAIFITAGAGTEHRPR